MQFVIATYQMEQKSPSKTCDKSNSNGKMAKLFDPLMGKNWIRSADMLFGAIQAVYG